MDGLSEAQHDNPRKRKLAENHAGNVKNIQFLKCSSLFKADLFHSLLHFGFNESSHQCNPGSLLLVESGILGFVFRNLTLGFRNSSPGIRNPAAIKIHNPNSTDKDPESSIWSPESTAWNPGSKTFLDYLIWGEMKKHSS